MPGISLIVNGASREVEVAGDVPLLYVLRNDLDLTGPQFGCGLSQCGACSVLVDGKEARSCVLPVRLAAGKEVTTLEGLPTRWASQRGLSPAEAEHTLHPVQQAWIDEQVPQCGFCQNGMMIKATELLDQTPKPTVAQIKNAFMSGSSPHLCRCGSYSAILDAVQRASILMAQGEVSHGQRIPRQRARRYAHPSSVRHDGRRPHCQLQRGGEDDLGAGDRGGELQEFDGCVAW